MPASIGSIGEQLDIYVRVGDALGPYSLVLTDESNVAIDLTNAILDAKCSKLADTVQADITMSVTVTNAAGGLATILLVDTSTLTPGVDYFTAQGTYAWRLRLTDALGRVRTLLYGTIFVAPGVLP